MIRILLAALCALSFQTGVRAATDAGLARPVVETLHGVTVADPFRHLEATDDPAVVDWMRAQSAAARRTLDAMPGRPALARRIGQLLAAAGPRLGEVQRRPGERVFLTRRGARDEQFRLFVRDAGRERLLVDPMAGAGAAPRAIDWFVASPRGRHVAVGLSSGGSEDSELFVFDAGDGRRLLGPVSRAEYGGVAWLDDDSGFFFTRLRAVADDAPPSARYAGAQAVFVRLGDDVERAPVALDFRSPGVAIDEQQDAPTVVPVAGSGWALGVVRHGTDRELALWRAPLADALAGRAEWTPLFGREAGVTAFEAVGERLFVLTHAGAPRSRLLETSLVAPDLARARVAVAEGDGVLTALARGADALYLRRRDGSASSLLRLPLTPPAALETVALPLRGSFEFHGADPALPGVLLALQGWTEPERLWSARPAAGGRVEVADTGLVRPGRFGSGRYVVREVLVASHDGARVPLAIVHRAGLPRDGRAPALLWGYAAYGDTEEPWFSPTRIAWLERGGVFAVANPRGSGAFGDEWYRGGLRETKPNSWKDFIAAAEYLVAERYTTPSRLGAWGASAGGVLVGRAITERPELFGAAVLSVGALDMVRAELEPNGPPNIPEFGSTATEAGLRALLAMSAYHHVADGVRYPAVLLTHGVNDARVEVWQSLKMAARLQQAGARPVLLRLDWDAGHGGGATRAQQAAESADILGFLRWQALGRAR